MMITSVVSDSCTPGVKEVGVKLEIDPQMVTIYTPTDEGVDIGIPVCYDGLILDSYVDTASDWIMFLEEY